MWRARCSHIPFSPSVRHMHHCFSTRALIPNRSHGLGGTHTYAGSGSSAFLAQWLVTYIRFARSLLSIFGHLGIYKNGSRVEIGSADYCNHFSRTSVCPCVPVAALLRPRARAPFRLHLLGAQDVASKRSENGAGNGPDIAKVGR